MPASPSLAWAAVRRTPSRRTELYRLSRCRVIVVRIGTPPYRSKGLHRAESIGKICWTRWIGRATIFAGKCGDKRGTDGEAPSVTARNPPTVLQGGSAMNSSLSRNLSRRTLIKGAAGSALLAGVGMPAIVDGAGRRHPHRSPDAAHRLSRAARRIRRHGRQARGRGNQRCRRRDRPQDRARDGGFGQSADRLRQGRAPDRARQGRDDHRRDFVGVRPRHRPGGEPAEDRVHQHRLQFRRAARRELQSVHVPHRGRELDVRDGGRPVPAARESGEGQEVVHADGRLRLRPRPPAGGQEIPGRQRRPVRGRRAGADRRRPTSRPIC